MLFESDKVMFEIYRETEYTGRYRVVYFTELQDHNKETEINHALAGEHFYDGFIKNFKKDEAKEIIDGILNGLKNGETVGPQDVENALGENMAKRQRAYHPLSQHFGAPVSRLHRRVRRLVLRRAALGRDRAAPPRRQGQGRRVRVRDGAGHPALRRANRPRPLELAGRNLRTAPAAFATPGHYRRRLRPHRRSRGDPPARQQPDRRGGALRIGAGRGVRDGVPDAEIDLQRGARRRRAVGPTRPDAARRLSRGPTHLPRRPGSALALLLR